MKKYFYKRYQIGFITLIFLLGYSAQLIAQNKKSKAPITKFKLPEGYLKEADNIPPFWLSTVEDVNSFLKKNIHKGKVEVIGTSAGGRPIHGVLYGQSRQGKGTTTFSGSLGFGDVGTYRGPDHNKTVYMAISSVHGGEFEGIVGMINLLSILETGKDLRGKEWPDIVNSFQKLDRVILVPIVNPDGRSRIPIKMETHKGANGNVHEYLNTGGNAEGKITGWPKIKKFIPMDFSLPSFPGGYPNDAGVNIQHDDFFGKRQPETQALFNITAQEKPDLILNMHTGAVYPHVIRAYLEPSLSTPFDTLFNFVHTALAKNGLQKTNDVTMEANPRLAAGPVGYNLDGALNLNSGTLSVLIESPSHGFSGKNSDGELVTFTPEMLLNAQLLCHQEAMRFLSEKGGRANWKNKR
ncbi:MAG: hypothetical protein H7Y07_14625 [Pyrinomonadaceae bacterium]|nr:hypothetical protein [Sphingobacteriaceae bacterium]